MTTTQATPTQLLTRIAATSLLPLLLLLVGCDTMDPNVAPPPNECALAENAAKAGCDGEAAFTIVVTAAEDGAGLWFDLTGALADVGQADGDQPHVALPDERPEIWDGTRTLRGGRGSIVLSFEGRIDEAEEEEMAEEPTWSGRFTITSGTRSYEDLQGAGTFSVHLDAAGHPVERFTGTVSR